MQSKDHKKRFNSAIHHAFRRSELESGMTTSPDPDQGAPLSFGQEQLWFIDKLTPDATTYHISMTFRLRGPLRTDILHDCLTRIVARHDALRMTFHSADGVPFQVTSPPARVELPVLALSGSAAQEEGQERERLLQDRLRQLASVPFDLERGPLYRYQLLKLADDDHVFVQILHHIVTDGWSGGVIANELNLAYRALLDGREPDLGEPGPSYGQYAAEQRAQMRGELLDEELAWWTERLAGLPTLEFPADRPRPAEPSRGGGSVTRPYPAELLARMRVLAKEHGVSLYMVIVSALNVVLSRYTGQAGGRPAGQLGRQKERADRDGRGIRGGGAAAGHVAGHATAGPACAGARACARAVGRGCSRPVRAADAQHFPAVSLRIRRGRGTP